MIIQNNISALRVRNNLNTNQKEKTKIGEKLSSGYRINRSADDAAGLSISETMRAQIRGLEQNQLNVTDGINLIQTADGAMGEMTDLLNRIRELTVQARNSTNTTIDKQAMQEEINGLRSEIERLSEDTEFNTKKILKGINGNITLYPDGYMPSWVNMPTGGLKLNNPDVNAGTQQDASRPLQGSSTLPDINGDYWSKTMTDNASAIIDFSNIAVPDLETNLKALLGNGFYSTCCTCSNQYSIAFSDTNSLPGNVAGVQTVINISDLITAAQNGTMSAPQIGEALVDRIKAQGNNSHYTFYEKNAGNPLQLVVYDWRDNFVPNNSYYGQVVNHITYIKQEKDIMLQVGPNSDQSMEIILPKIDLYALNLQYGWNDYYGVTDTIKTVTTYPDAIWGWDTNGEWSVISWGQPVNTTQTLPGNGTLADVDHAINYITASRAKMGAYQNALEHIYNNVSNTGENLQGAESTIRDADMAELMVYFSTHDILLEAGNSMLTQANSSPQRILELLK